MTNNTGVTRLKEWGNASGCTVLQIDLGMDLAART